jgi:hypothetical protein
VLQYFGSSNTNTALAIQNRSVVNVTMADTVNDMQTIFLDHTSSIFYDMAFVNLQGHYSDMGFGPLNSQLQSVESHVLIWNCTLPYQNWNLRADIATANEKYAPDAYSEFRGNVIYSMAWSGTPDADLVNDHNHFMTGSVPSGATNTSTGGTLASLFVDATTGNYTPVADSPLTTGAITAVVPFDAANHARSTTTALGAYAASGEGEVSPTVLIRASAKRGIAKFRQ